jgi:hypothetical protein
MTESALRLARQALYAIEAPRYLYATATDKLRELVDYLTAADAQAAESLTPDDIRNLVRDSGLDWHKGFGPSDGEPNRFEQLVRAAYRRGQRASAEPVEARWISVEDRLPEAGVRVLMYRPDADESPACDENVRVGFIRKATNGVWDGAHRVTHWMPLPAAPTPDAASEPQESQR